MSKHKNKVLSNLGQLWLHRPVSREKHWEFYSLPNVITNQGEDCKKLSKGKRAACGWQSQSGISKAFPRFISSQVREMLIAATLLISQHIDIIRSRIKLLIWKNHHLECHRSNSYEALPPLALHLLKNLSLLSSIFF